ncbi:MAG: acyl carrier protein [Coriobacteriia bacterium]|nr:acyl carrier protein [Coriobacteriia bacterium]
MSRTEVVNRIKKIIVEQLDVSEDTISESSLFIKDLGADSLDIVEIVMAFEDEFEASIPDTAIEHIATVGDAADHILAQ